MQEPKFDESKIAPPKLASLLLRQCRSYKYFDSLEGDLLESFYELAVEDKKKANHWYWQEVCHTCLSLAKSSPKTRQIARKLTLAYFTLLLFFSFHLIGWLAFFSDPSTLAPELWLKVTNGHLYLLFGEQEFWLFAPEVWQNSGRFTFITDTQLMQLSAALGVVWYLLVRDRSITLSAYIFRSLAILYLPSICGLLFLSTHVLPMNQVGPVLAAMVYPVFYLTPCMFVLLWRQVRVSPLYHE